MNKKCTQANSKLRRLPRRTIFSNILELERRDRNSSKLIAFAFSFSSTRQLSSSPQEGPKLFDF